VAPTNAGEVNKIIRGVILQLVSENHLGQNHRLTLTVLHAALSRLGYSLGRNELVTLMQNLNDRGYLGYKELRDKDTWRLDMIEIQITPAGVDVVEGTRVDPAVEV
jgi:hypothetical protein